MEIIFLGTNDVGIRIYEWLCQRDSTDVIAMITEPDQFDLIRREDPDLILSVGFDHLVPSEVLEIPSEGAINVHPSFLPYNRGKSPNVWPLVEGTKAGVSIHYMDAEFDTGDIIERREVETDFSDTGKDLHERLEEAQFDLVTEIWSQVENRSIQVTPQEEDAGNYHTKDDFVDLCELDPDEEVHVKHLLDRLRAMTFSPFDNAYINLDGETYYIDVEIRKETDDSGQKTEGLLSSYDT